MSRSVFHIRPRSSSISPELIGTWKIGNREYEISADGFYFVVSPLKPYAINEPHLNWDGWLFERRMGSPGGLAGVWQDPSTSEELYLRPDKSLTWYDPSLSRQLFGKWNALSAPDKLGTAEARAFLIEDGYHLAFDLVYGGQHIYEFVVSDSELTLTDPLTFEQIVYTRHGGP